MCVFVTMLMCLCGFPLQRAPTAEQLSKMLTPEDLAGSILHIVNQPKTSDIERIVLECPDRITLRNPN